MSFDLKLENGDLVIDGTSDLAQVFNDTKLRQDVIKIIVTPLGSMTLFPWYGSPLSERVIGTAAGLDPKLREAEIQNSLIFALNNLQALQSEQERQQFITPAETIGRIGEISIQISPFDPRQFTVIVSVITRRANVVEETFNMRI